MGFAARACACVACFSRSGIATTEASAATAKTLSLTATVKVGEATATTLAAQVSLTRQAVVKHLTVLDQAGLVTGRRVGREVRYSVRPETLDATASRLAALASDWDTRLARLKEQAEAR